MGGFTSREVPCITTVITRLKSRQQKMSDDVGSKQRTSSQHGIPSMWQNFPHLRTMLISICAFGFSSILLCSNSVGFAQQDGAKVISETDESPMGTVKNTLTPIFAILNDHSLKTDDKRHKIENIVASRFDYGEMSRRTLASHWNRLTEVERTEFVELFKTFLADRYADRIEKYAGEKVEYLGERRDGNYAEIQTKLISSKVDYPMDYRLMQKDGRWYAYDLIADGVSLVRNYRSQFEKIIRTDSYGALVRRLKDRSLTGDLGSKS